MGSRRPVLSGMGMAMPAWKVRSREPGWMSMRSRTLSR